MSISKRIVEAHGGCIEIGNGAGAGTEILIVLPRLTK
jgi:signal transduction histidine kinase